jgi:hypothetical protein
MKDIKWITNKEDPMFGKQYKSHIVVLENIELAIYKDIGEKKQFTLQISRLSDDVIIEHLVIETELRYAKTKLIALAVDYLSKKIKSYNKDLKEIAPII